MAAPPVVPMALMELTMCNILKAPIDKTFSDVAGDITDSGGRNDSSNNSQTGRRRHASV